MKFKELKVGDLFMYEDSNHRCMYEKIEEYYHENFNYDIFHFNAIDWDNKQIGRMCFFLIDKDAEVEPVGYIVGLSERSKQVDNEMLKRLTAIMVRREDNEI